MLNLFLYLAIFLFGLAVGSFLNCVIYRLEKEENFLKGRSFCPYCRHLLSWLDLIPLFSFFLLKGKCRYCKQKISWQYPLVEIATGLLFLLIFNFFTPLDMKLSNGAIFNQQFISILSQFITTSYLFIISCFLIIIFVYDLKHYIIPDKVIYPAITIAGIYNFQFVIFNQLSIFKFSILSAFGAAAFFLAIVLVSRGKWMGVGDIKLSFLMGLFLGFPNILTALFLSFFLGAIIGIGLILRKKKTLKSEIPFAPFLVSGTLIAFFWGEEIMRWYLDNFQFFNF